VQQSTPLARIRGVVGSIIDWLRGGYPDGAPRSGYSPLLALNGPIALSTKQIAQIAAALGDEPTDATDIGVAITNATGRLPPTAPSSSRYVRPAATGGSPSRCWKTSP
jgi:hypothetical protein